MTDEAAERARSIREWLESHVSHISRVVCEKHLANELRAYAAERDSKWCEMIARVCGGMAYTREDDLPEEAERYIRAFAADERVEAERHGATRVQALVVQRLELDRDSLTWYANEHQRKAEYELARGYAEWAEIFDRAINSIRQFKLDEGGDAK